MNKILQFLGVGKGNLIDSLVNGVDKFVTTAEEKEKLKQDMEKIVSGFVLEASKLALEDVVSARSREVDLKGTLGAWVMNGCACIMVFIFAAEHILPWLGYTEPTGPGYQNSSKTLEYILIAIIGYWFGASAAGARKDSVIHELSKKQ